MPWGKKMPNKKQGNLPKTYREAGGDYNTHPDDRSLSGNIGSSKKVPSRDEWDRAGIGTPIGEREVIVEEISGDDRWTDYVGRRDITPEKELDFDPDRPPQNSLRPRSR
jgi:hypothetical protein